MLRKLALIGLLLGLGLAFWLWRGNTPPAPPLAAPQAQPAQAHPLDSAQIESSRTEQHQEVAKQQPTLLIVLCRAKETGVPLAEQTVYVIDATPTARVVPQVQGPRGKLGDEVTTGADGRAEIELPAGVATTLFVNPARPAANASARREIAPLTAGEQRELVIELATQEDAHFHARVLARETHAPIAGAEIRGGSRPLTTDADGRFDLSNSSWSMQRLSILALGYAETVVMAQPGHETPEKALVIELERSCTLVGQLQGAGDAAKGGRLRMVVTTEGYRLTTQDPSERGSVQAEYDHTWRAEFDATGRAEIAGLVPNAPLRVSVFAGATRLVELADPIMIAPGATREVELKASETCRLTGVVRDDGGAVVSDATLWLLRAGRSPRLYLESYEEQDRIAEANTDARGRFAFANVNPGTWRLGPAPKSYRDGTPIPADALAPIAILVEIAAGEQVHEVELVVHRGLTITGSVLDPDGKPVGNASVGGHADKLWIGASCGADGTYALGPLAPGSYSVDASPNFHPELAPSEPVQVEAGARDVVLRLRRGGTLAGRVVDADSGQGVAAKITVSVPGDKTAWIHVPRSKADGAFGLANLLPGSYALVATLGDGRVGVLKDVVLASGASVRELVIPVRPGARLRVRYEGKQSHGAIRVEQSGVIVEMDGVEKNTSKTFSAPAGPIVVRCLVGDDHREIVRELTLEAGKEQELVFKDED